jgi:peptidoglycan L-alanyl-D-glutamate endopeptidase CwlK
MPESPLRKRQALFWYKIAQVLIEAVRQSTPICVIEWIRDEARQRILVARKASKTMNSKHLTGLAVDFCFLADIEDDGTINWIPDKYKSLGEYAESIGLKWGGRFGDDPATKTIEGWDAGHLELE